jgi:hypothetical protein
MLTRDWLSLAVILCDFRIAFKTKADFDCPSQIFEPEEKEVSKGTDENLRTKLLLLLSF